MSERFVIKDSLREELSPSLEESKIKRFFRKLFHIRIMIISITKNRSVVIIVNTGGVTIKEQQ